jgi:hypothetical protein
MLCVLVNTVSLFAVIKCVEDRTTIHTTMHWHSSIIFIMIRVVSFFGPGRHASIASAGSKRSRKTYAPCDMMKIATATVNKNMAFPDKLLPQRAGEAHLSPLTGNMINY